MGGLKNLDEIFGGSSTEMESQSEDKIVQLDIDKLVDYRKGNVGKNRYSDADMLDLVESIKNNGVIEPAVVRPIENGMYEIILGHHRRDASLLAGLDTLPCIIKDIDDSSAELMFMDSNIQKGFEKLTHSEKAELIYRRNEALKAQGKRTDLISEEEKESTSSVRDEFHLSGSTIKRYLRIYILEGAIKELLDNGEIALRTAVNLSYISPSLQNYIYDLITTYGFKVTEKDSEKLKEDAAEGNLTETLIEQLIMGDKTKNQRTEVKVKAYKIKPIIFSKYFTQNQKEKEIDEILEKALEQYFSSGVV